MRNKFSVISFALNFVTIFFIVNLNYKIYNKYINSNGKTKALFGLVELGYLEYKFYLLIPIIFSIGLSIYAKKRFENRYTYLSALLISALLLILVFVRIWSFFV
jgi:hypothetical protein